MFASKTARAARFLLVLALASIASLARADGHDERASASAEPRMTHVRAAHADAEGKEAHATRAELLELERLVIEKLGARRDRGAVQPEFTDRG